MTSNAQPFAVYEVPENSREADEPVGSKPKFWFTRDGEPWMFKASRPGTGEDWAEVVAAELGAMIGLPHAEYQLAVWRGKRGIVTPKFFPGEGHGLILGNELLAGFISGYKETERRPQLHTLENVWNALNARNVQLPIGGSLPQEVGTAAEALMGYFMFDAWIGNADRHHENWALIKPTGRDPYLAPTFDHASSLGRELRDTERHERLVTKDKGRQVEVYANRCESALFATSADTRPMRTRSVARLACGRFTPAAQAWIMRIAAVGQSDIAAVFERLPLDWISPDAKTFAIELLQCNRKALTQLVAES